MLTGYKVAALSKQGDQLDARGEDRKLADGRGRSRSMASSPGSAPSQSSIWPRRPVWTSTTAFVVDEYLRTSHPDVYAAGDIAAFWQSAPGRRRRVEHEDNAKRMGRLAGTNMAGETEPYDHLPFFYSDLFDMGYEAVGDVDTRLRDGGRVGGAVPQGRHLLPQRRPGAGRAALERLGSGRCGPGLITAGEQASPAEGSLRRPDSGLARERMQRRMTACLVRTDR